MKTQITRSLLEKTAMWVLWLLPICAAYPFPVLHQGRPRATDTGYVKRFLGEPSVFASPSRGLRSPWSYVTPFGAEALRPAQQTREAPVYGVPSNSLWTDSLLRYAESPQLTVNRELPGEFLTQPVGPPDYEDGEEYEDTTNDDDDLAGYPDVPESLPGTLDWGFAPSAQRYEDRNDAYREMLLPYLLYSAMDQENAKRRPSDLFGVEQRRLRLQDNKVPTDQKRASPASEPSTSGSNHTTVSSTPSTPVATSSEPSKPTTEATTTRIVTPAGVKDEVKPVIFDRGQKEFPIFRPPSNNRVAALKALTWPKELERDDTEEQKRQLRQLPLEESTRHEKMASRRWPAALDEVDDWLTAQLNDLKTRDH